MNTFTELFYFSMIDKMTIYSPAAAKGLRVASAIQLLTSFSSLKYLKIHIQLKINLFHRDLL